MTRAPMAVMPAARPSKPSKIFTVLVIPKIQTNTKALAPKPLRPITPPKGLVILSIPTPPPIAKKHAKAIAVKRATGDKRCLSSNNPTINNTKLPKNTPTKSTGCKFLPNKLVKFIIYPTTSQKAKKIAIPPPKGTGRLCSLRPPSGISKSFMVVNNFMAPKVKSADSANETRKKYIKFTQLSIPLPHLLRPHRVVLTYQTKSNLLIYFPLAPAKSDALNERQIRDQNQLLPKNLRPPLQLSNQFLLLPNLSPRVLTSIRQFYESRPRPNRETIQFHQTDLKIPV